MKLLDLHKLLWEASEPEHRTVYLQLALPHFTPRKILYFVPEIFNSLLWFKENLEDSIEELILEDLEERLENSNFTDDEAHDFGNCKIYGFVIFHSIEKDEQENSVIVRLPVQGESLSISEREKDYFDVSIFIREVEE
jgi:hypothetical protein